MFHGVPAGAGLRTCDARSMGGLSGDFVGSGDANARHWCKCIMSCEMTEQGREQGGPRISLKINQLEL
jgi:hypothetical protein